MGDHEGRETPDLTRREVFRLGVGAAAVAAAVTTFAAATAPAFAGPSGGGKAITAASFRIRVDDAELKGVRSAELGEIRTIVEVTPGTPPSLVYAGLEPSTTLRISVVPELDEVLADWYAKVKGGDSHDVRDVAIDIVSPTGTVLRTYRSRQTSLGGFKPHRMRLGQADKVAGDEYHLICALGQGVFTIEEPNPGPAIVSGSGVALRVADTGSGSGNFEGGWTSVEPAAVRFGSATGHEDAEPGEFVVDGMTAIRPVRAVQSATTKFLTGLLDGTQVTPIDVEIAQRTIDGLVGRRLLYKVLVLTKYSLGALNATSKDLLTETFECVARDLEIKG